MHAFITGATGFLGKHITQQLLSEGWQVTAFCRDLEKTKVFPFTGANFVEGDLQSIVSLRAIIKDDTDAIFNVAGDTSTWQPNHRQQYLTNVVGTKNLAKIALEKNVTRFIQTSTLGVFGIHKDIITEESPMLGNDMGVAYYKSKFQADEILREFMQQGLDPIFLHPAVILGPYDTHNWIQLFDNISNDELLGIPPGVKSFCYASDVAQAHVNAFKKGRSGESYLLAGRKGDFLTVAQWIAKRMEKPLPSRVMSPLVLKIVARALTFVSRFTKKEPTLSVEKARMVCSKVEVSSDKAKRELNYNTDRKIDEMLELTYQWWKMNKRNE